MYYNKPSEIKYLYLASACFAMHTDFPSPSLHLLLTTLHVSLLSAVLRLESVSGRLGGLAHLSLE